MNFPGGPIAQPPKGGEQGEEEEEPRSAMGDLWAGSGGIDDDLGSDSDDSGGDDNPDSDSDNGGGGYA